MDDKTLQIDLHASIDDFFLRAGLHPQDRLRCYAFIEHLYPGESIVPASCQGYCSLTLFVGEALVVQFRPDVYRLDLRTAHAAREVYGSFAPDTQYLGRLPAPGLLIYSMNRMDGVSYKDFRSAHTATTQSTEYRRRLCKGFAGFLAKAWHGRSNASIALGLIGSSIVSRLKSLVTDLPPRFQSTARHVLGHLHRIETLPWVLTHGDVVAANIMVDPSTCHLNGFVDWAEAERLPFGVCLYGLEEILGEMTPSGFCYHSDSEDLRSFFWEELILQIPQLEQSNMLQAVKLARDLGVLLWHGIAFDDGAIDRVVQEGRDIEEIHKLDAFLEPDEREPGLESLIDIVPSAAAYTTNITSTPAIFPLDPQRQHISGQ